jgi:hypothetical protein
MFTSLNTMETRYKIFKFIQKCLSGPATVTRKTKSSWGVRVYVRCLFTFLWQTFNVISLFRSYEQRSCPSTFIAVWGRTAGPLPHQIPSDGAVFQRIIFCVGSTCSISVPSHVAAFRPHGTPYHVLSVYITSHASLCLSFIQYLYYAWYSIREFKSDVLRINNK